MDRKTQEQYEKLVLTPIKVIIPQLAIPTIISMMVSMIYNLVDAYFVGKIGTAAAAAVGILMSVQAIYQAIGFMCGHGSGSNISRLLGQGRVDEASNYASTAFLMSIVITTILTIPALIFITPLMHMLGSTTTILPYARIYGYYMLICGPTLAASCVLNNIMRYEGKASLAMIGLVSGGVLNMIGDPIFMFGLKMGIHGAGLSTALSQYISLGILFYMFYSGKTISKISFKHFHLRKLAIGNIVSNGLPSLLRQVLNSVSTMTLNIAANPYGDAAIAAMTIVGRIVAFFASMMVGIGQGYQPVGAYNYGAKKYKRIRQGFYFTWGLGEILLMGAAIVGLLFSRELVSIFRDDQAVITIGVRALRFQCFALILQPLGIVCNMMFQSIGKAKIASLLASLRSGLYYIPALIILPMFLGITGVEISQLVGDALTFLTCVPIVIRFFRQLPNKNIETEIDHAYQQAKEE